MATIIASPGFALMLACCQRWEKLGEALSAARAERYKTLLLAIAGDEEGDPDELAEAEALSAREAFDEALAAFEEAERGIEKLGHRLADTWDRRAASATSPEERRRLRGEMVAIYRARHRAAAAGSCCPEGD
jgi:hypothetical protein